MEIIDLQLRSVFGRIEEKGFAIKLTDSAKEFIAEKGFDKQYGARPLNRALQKYLEDPIADEILRGVAKEGDTLLVDMEEGAEQVSIKVEKGNISLGKKKTKKSPTLEKEKDPDAPEETE